MDSYLFDEIPAINTDSKINIHRLAFLIVLFQIGIANSQELTTSDYQSYLERIGFSVRGHRQIIEVEYENLDIPSRVTLEVSSDGRLVSKTQSILTRGKGNLRTQTMNCLITPEFRFIRNDNLFESEEEGRSFRRNNNIAWLAKGAPEGYSLGATVVPIPELLVYDRFSEKYWHEIILLPGTAVRIDHLEHGFQTLVAESKEFGNVQFKFSGSTELSLESINIEKSGSQLGVQQASFSRYVANIGNIVTSYSNGIPYVKSILNASELYESPTEGDIKVNRSIVVLSRNELSDDFSEETVLLGYGVAEEEDVEVANNHGVPYRVINGKPVKVYFPETDVPVEKAYFRKPTKFVVVWNWLIGLMVILGFVSLRLHAKYQAR